MVWMMNWNQAGSQKTPALLLSLITTTVGL